ncbi:MAG: peptide deformylase [Verrucomicrobiae bacterium]|jgi:peptide deformylase|nr:peptide deformylase [Verrucomicrobiae bacterium]
MILEVVTYGHPVLRQNGAEIAEITPGLEELIADMFETMEDYHGIGLAAQQVAHPIRLTVIDIRGVTDRPSTLEINGEEADPTSIMPLVLINPELETEGDFEAAPEGCLSFPDIFGDVIRPGFVKVKAMNERGESIEFKAGGLLGRCIQHEVDHLKGILFIDRMDRETKEKLKPDFEALAEETRQFLNEVG